MKKIPAIITAIFFCVVSCVILLNLTFDRFVDTVLFACCLCIPLQAASVALAVKGHCHWKYPVIDILLNYAILAALWEFGNGDKTGLHLYMMTAFFFLTPIVIACLNHLAAKSLWSLLLFHFNSFVLGTSLVKLAAIRWYLFVSHDLETPGVGSLEVLCASVEGLASILLSLCAYHKPIKPTAP